MEHYETFKQSSFRDFPSFNFSVLDETQQTEAKKIVKDFVDSDIGKHYLEDIELIGEEVEFGLDMKLQPVSYYAKDAIMRGKIDKIVKKYEEKILYVNSLDEIPDGYELITILEE